MLMSKFAESTDRISSHFWASVKTHEYFCPFRILHMSSRILQKYRVEQIYDDQSVKCYRGGRKIDLIPSISEIQSQTWYHCVQYTRRQLMSLISHF